MGNKILTISIAAYNDEKYIRQALESVIDDDIIDDIEVLVIDDGGTDNTLAIAQKYSERYPQSIFLVHKENGGYGSTINLSIELATGKYFKQLDGDDWFKTEELKSLINVMRNVSVDCILTDFDRYSESTGKFSYKNLYSYMQDGEYEINSSGLRDQPSMYTSAFKTKLLKNMPYRIAEHCFYADVEYAAFPIPYINTIYILHKSVYIYRIGVDGQSMNSQEIAKHYKEHEKIFWELLIVYDTIPMEKAVNREIFQRILSHRISEYYRFLCVMPVSDKIRKEMIMFTQKLQENCQDVLNKSMSEYKLVQTLVATKFISYPLLSCWEKIKWKREGRLL